MDDVLSIVLSVKGLGFQTVIIFLKFVAMRRRIFQHLNVAHSLCEGLLGSSQSSQQDV